MSEITPKDLHSMLIYDKETGDFTWRNRTHEMFDGYTPKRMCSTWNARYAGKTAFGYVNSRGYKTCRILNKSFLAHRVAWAMHFGEWPSDGLEVDHINGDKTDNRICNLRLASRTQNRVNTTAYKSNKTGVKGVYQTKYGTYIAQIRHGGSIKYLGSYKTLDEARVAFERAALEDHGQFAAHVSRAK